MTNEIDFNIELVQTSTPNMNKFRVTAGTYDVKITLRQSFSRQDVEKVTRLLNLSNIKATITLTRRMDELNKYTDEEILEYLRTRNNDNY
jgi:hypothetical protein